MNFVIYERIAHQVQQGEMKELAERVKSLKSSRIKLCEMSPEDICDLLDAETDEEESIAIVKKLSDAILEKVELAQSERSADINNKIRQKIGEQEKNLSRMIKFRIVDANKPNRTGLISWWSPTEDLLEFLKVGQCVEVLYTTPVSSSKEILINAGKSSVIKLSKTTRTLEEFQTFFRSESKITELAASFTPPNDEFDAAFIVICIIKSDDEDKTKWQKAYVADESTNLLCLNFWLSIADCAFDDVIVARQILYARNLQWRTTHALSKIPQAFVDKDNTLLIVHPKENFEQQRLEQLKEAIGDVNEFVAKCEKKIDIEKLSNSFGKENRSANNTKITENFVKEQRVSQRPIFSNGLQINLPTSHQALQTSSAERLSGKRLGMSRFSTNNSITKIKGSRSAGNSKNRPTFSR